MAKVFYEDEFVAVTDTVFKNKMGGSYPIKNITSVEIKLTKPAVSAVSVFALIFGMLAGCVGVIALLVEAGGFAVAMFMLCYLGIYIYFAMLKKELVLLIGGGGVPQTALTFASDKTENKNRAQKIADAINESIADLQRAER